MSMNTLTKEDISNIIDSPNLTSQEICEVIKKELNIDIDSGLSREEMVDSVYDAYQLLYKKLKTVRLKLSVEAKVNKEIKINGTFKTSASNLLLNLIQEGKHTKRISFDITNTEKGLWLG